MNKQNRFKSKLAWMSLVSAGILIAQSMGYIDVDKASAFTEAGQVILGVLVAIGILNDPTNKEGF